jgi:hypothetical protein
MLHNVYRSYFNVNVVKFGYVRSWTEVGYEKHTRIGLGRKYDLDKPTLYKC